MSRSGCSLVAAGCLAIEGVLGSRFAEGVLLFWCCLVSTACLLFVERILILDDLVSCIYTFLVSRLSPLREPEVTPI